MDMTRYTIDGEARVNKIVKDRGTSGGVYLPASWRGRQVAVILLKGPALPEREEEGNEPGPIVFFDVEVDE